MSIIRCELCSTFVDSDDDPECFCEVIDYGDDGATRKIVMCQGCRDRRETELAREP